MFKKLNDNVKLQRKLIIVLFTIIPVLLLLTFSYYPLLKMIQYSFTDWDGISPVKHWVGLSNYKLVLTNPEYFTVFKSSLYYFVATFIQLAVALLFATILSFKVKFANFWKGVLFFPYLMNGVAIGFIFMYFFKPDGTLDTLMNMFGLGGQIQLWLGNRAINNISLAFTSIWRYTGINFIIFLGSMQAIDPEVYEAAEIDGANKWQQFRYIIMPAIKNIIFINVILGVSGAISVFEIPYIMTGGANGTMTFVIKTIDTAFEYNHVGVASAMAIILLFIVIVVSWIQKMVTDEREERH
ncbi:sugar ABC transporter permease [uncultured Lactobacillus sp.]|uniref:carbohydrate ABC transporter permease n=1 Tax=uncultured Lactobacillus sp. TaxID=153152 RepID=UPI00280384A9|nr:sugar ABC transporter permease [uncultured Lactobacillus sp.]